MLRPSTGTRPTRTALVLSDAGPDGSAVLLTSDGVEHVLSTTALALWQLCDGQTTAAEMAEAVAEFFGLPPARCEHDVLAGLSHLSEAGLVSWS